MTQREEFEAWWEEFSSAHEDWRFADSAALRWAAWQAAQAAQPAQHPDEFRCPYCLDKPAGKVCITTDQAGAIVAVTRQDSEGRILEIIAEVAQPAHAHAIDTSPERVEKQAVDVQVPRWIAAADRMPEPQVRVLGYEPQYNIVDVDMWFGPDFQWGYTYWMPIPAAPSTKEQTE